MINTLNVKMVMAFMLGISFLSLQASSMAVGSETYQDNTVIITVDSTNLQFSPSEVTISEGQTVRFFWSGEFLEHNAVASSGIFSTGSTQTEMDYAFTFDKGTNNTYDFICEPHQFLNMVGTVTVTPSEDESNSTEPIGSSQEEMNSSSSAMGGFLFVSVLGVVILVSRYFK